MTEFVDGWILGHVLGEGAYGEVRLVINKSTKEAVAMKMVDLKKHPDAKNNVRKETTIHRMLSNPFIIQYFGQRSESNLEYIFLEYASGGELFDRIEPDIGMPTNEARKYFRQLLFAIEYLHSRGVAHRDLKPENLLLDAHNNLKVSDFGLATVYRLNGKERLLDKKCGTLPYVAPEVLERPYLAEPADLWACGIILVASLAGELPWDQASKSCSEYVAWINDEYSFLTPWNKLETSSLSFLRKILVHAPSKRYLILDIKNHTWFNSGLTSGENIMNTKCESKMSLDSKDIRLRRSDQPTFCFSQPELPPIDVLSNIKLGDRTGLSFSQPISFEDLLVSSQLSATHTQASMKTFHNLVRRMTRCFVTTSSQNTMKTVTECLVQKSYHYRVNNFGTITISTVDKRKMPLVFKINIIEMDNKTLVDFRLSKGCGIEFKKEFIKIKELLSHIVLQDIKLQEE